MRRRKQPEQALQIAVAQFLRLALRPPTFWYAVDHGAGRMTPAASGLLKIRGGRRGIPDLIAMHPRELLTIVVGIELKAPKGRPTPDQQGVAEAFALVNASYVFCRSLEDVADTLRAAGIPTYAEVWGKGVRVGG